MAIEVRDRVAGKVCRSCGEWKPVSDFHKQVVRGEPIGDGFKSRCRACLNIQRNAHRAANVEEYRARARKFHREHSEQVKAKNYAYRDAHREQYREMDRARYERNQEELKAAQRVRNAAYRASRPDEVRAYYRTYYRSYKQAHPVRLRQHQRRHELRRRARKNEAEGCHSEAEWEALKQHYRHTCLRCGKHEPEIVLTRDHVVPLTKGGSDWITNIQPLCAVCNSSKNNKIVDYRLNW